MIMIPLMLKSLFKLDVILFEISLIMVNPSDTAVRHCKDAIAVSKK